MEISHVLVKKLTAQSKYAQDQAGRPSLHCIQHKYWGCYCATTGKGRLFCLPHLLFCALSFPQSFAAKKLKILSLPPTLSFQPLPPHTCIHTYTYKTGTWNRNSSTFEFRFFFQVTGSKTWVKSGSLTSMTQVVKNSVLVQLESNHWVPISDTKIHFYISFQLGKKPSPQGQFLSSCSAMPAGKEITLSSLTLLPVSQSLP